MKLRLTRTSLSLALALSSISLIVPSSGAGEPTTLDTVQVTKTRPKEEILYQRSYADSMFGGNGTRGDGGGGPAPNATAKEQKTDDRKKDCPQTEGNPVVLYTGNKVEPELDFASRGELGLFLQRTYNHQWSATGLFGNHWLTNFDFSLAFSDSERIAWIQHPDGSRLKLIADQSLSRWNEEKAQPVAYLVRNGDGSFTLHNENNGLETYNADGYITTLQNEQGVAWTFTYEAGYLQRVTHSSGRNVLLTWNGDQLVQVTDPAGNVYRYTYTANAFDYGRSRLASAVLPGSPATTITYHYEDARYPGGLTGKSFNGVRYSYFAYDDQQRAILSEHAGGVERNTFTYSVESTEQVVPAPAPVRPGGLRPLEGTGWCDYRGGAGRFCYPSEVNNQSRMASARSQTSSAEATKATPVKNSTTVTNPLGRRTTYAYEDGRQVAVTGDPTPRCAASYKEHTYDANGYPDVVSDFADNLTDFDYSPQGFLLKRVEGVGTSAQRTTTYEWDMVGNHLLKETMAGDHETVYTYESRGNIASITLRNLSAKGVAGQTRITNYTYTYHPNGLKATMTEDGPLPQDNVTYTFTATGDLSTVVNSLGHTVAYSEYDGLGNPAHVTAPNGGITVTTRDARGRVLLQREPAGTGWATTTMSYDGAGNVASVTQPNGVTTRFEYDAARRLLSEATPLGDGTYATKKRSYDAASNVTRTEIVHTDYPGSTTVDGYVDKVAHAGEWQWYIFGWACTTGSSSPIPVHAYAEGGVFIGSAQANLASEAGVSAACNSTGSAHRYQIPITLAQRQQLGGKKITVYGISPKGGEYNKALGNSGNVPVPAAGVVGDVAAVVQDANWNYYVQGWTCDIGVGNPIEAHLYLGGAAGTGTGVASVVANLPSDANVANACQSTATAHTYRIPLDWSMRHVHGGKAVYVHGVPASGPASLLSYSGSYTVPPLVRGAELVSFTASNSHIFNGEQTTLTAKFRNTGDYVWDGGTYLYWGKLTASQPLAIGTSVAPGQIATVQWSVAPVHNGSGVGSYAYVVKMADGYGAWGPQATVTIAVENPSVYCPPNKPFCEDPK